jgi:hypothetical protein
LLFADTFSSLLSDSSEFVADSTAATITATVISHSEIARSKTEETVYLQILQSTIYKEL